MTTAYAAGFAHGQRDRVAAYPNTPEWVRANTSPPYYRGYQDGLAGYPPEGPPKHRTIYLPDRHWQQLRLLGGSKWLRDYLDSLADER